MWDGSRRAGTVDQDVQASVPPHGLDDKTARRGVIGDIRLDVAAADLRGHPLAGGNRPRGVHDHGDPVSGQGASDGRPYPAR